MKLARHEKIIELIKEYDIDTQEELAARLNEAGFKVTQATVSRDIRALKMTGNPAMPSCRIHSQGLGISIQEC